MKQSVKLIYAFILGLMGLHVHAQYNLLGNGGFEGIIQSGNYPRVGEILYDRCAPGWFSFNASGDARWFMDTIWTPIGNNGIDPMFQTGYYKTGDFNSSVPWSSGYNGDTMFQLPAHGGLFFIGFDARTDGPVREGIQAKASDCGLNSGFYNLEAYFTRAYGSVVTSHIFFSLSDQFNARRRILDDFTIFHPTNNTGQWDQYINSFQIDINDLADLEDEWFAITGQIFGDSDPRNYVFFDDVRLYRPCDQILECIPTHGQICPSVATMLPPADPLRIGNISNASDLHLKIYVNNSQVIKDTVYHNANGLPDFRFTRLSLPISTAFATYQYDLEITNACGGFKKTGSILVRDTAAYNPITPYLDTTATWTGVPIPCCLSSITLQNMQIVGDVSYIVRDEIIVQNGVTMAPNSHVTLQAGNVTELSNVEFDGTNSTLEIVEVPCPNRMASGQGCGGGSMVMDAGEFVIPAQATTESQSTVKGVVAHTELSTSVQPAIETETRLWAYPNPFEKEFQIGFALPEPMPCTVVVKDIQMQTIRTILQEKEMLTGMHQLSIDLAGLPAGVYLLQLQAGGRSYHHRIVKQ